MFTSKNNKCMHSSMKSDNLDYCEPTQSLKHCRYFIRKRTSLVYKGQNVLHKVSFDTNSMAILDWQILK